MPTIPPQQQRIRGTRISAGETYNLWLDSPVLATTRPCKDPMDFGDPATIGKHLKRRNLTSLEQELGLDFGLFLGQHEVDGKEKWVVAIKSIDGSQIVEGELFPSLQSLKEAWQLD